MCLNLYMGLWVGSGNNVEEKPSEPLADDDAGESVSDVVVAEQAIVPAEVCRGIDLNDNVFHRKVAVLLCLQ